MTKHFISKACEGEKCRMCGRPAAHKVGEEIPPDEPCGTCGATWRTGHMDKPTLVHWDGQQACQDAYHSFGGARSRRHNLTAYVCCEHFRRILGPAVNCGLMDKIDLASDVAAAEVALRKAIHDLPGAVGDLERKQMFDLIERAVNRAVWSETDLGVDG